MPTITTTVTSAEASGATTTVTTTMATPVPPSKAVPDSPATRSATSASFTPQCAATSLSRLKEPRPGRAF